jgi:tRNA-Thr(GGU) m(6)t(6)A37 methyltransferase TsaA
MENQQTAATFSIKPIGFINSQLTNLEDCPHQESENAPEAYLELHPSFAEGIKDIAAGNKLVILTWFHLADREVLKCYRRNEIGSKEFGVFSTRSPNRPNPIGLHVVTVLEIIDKQRIKISAMEALNGTPVIDIKPYIN